MPFEKNNTYGVQTKRGKNKSSELLKEQLHKIANTVVNELDLGRLTNNQRIQLPSDFILLLHLSLVLLLMIIFPYSKLLHAPGLFFSPTRNQTDTARDQRHISDWAKSLESNK